MIVIATFSSSIKKYIDQYYSDRSINQKTKKDENIHLGINDEVEVEDEVEVIILDIKTGIKNLVPEVLNSINILISYELSNSEADLLKDLKAVIVPMTGLEGYDEDYFKARSIPIYNSHCNAPYVAERGMGILMTLAGKIIVHSNSLKKGNWIRSGEAGRWTTLRNKKIGIYGYGHIGKAFEQMVLPFSSEIYIINRHKQHPSYLNQVDNLEDLTKQVDILFIAVPGNKHTFNTIGINELRHMKNGFVINVGRGPVVNQEALLEVLEDHSLAGYGSDVWYNYPEKNEKLNPSDVDLSRFEHVVMTPHNAWNFDGPKNLVKEEIVEHLKLIMSWR